MNELLILTETEFLEVEAIQQELLEVETTSADLLEVAQQGPQGPPGPAGPAGGSGVGGSGDLHYTHGQITPASTWVVSHNLGKHPSVTVVDSAGEECEGEVLYPSPDQCVLIFSAAFSGRAFLN